MGFSFKNGYYSYMLNEMGILKFLAIIICFFIAAAGNKHALDKKDSRLLVLALMFTVFADFFLVIAFRYHIGLILFCAVQTLYIRRFGTKKILRFLPLALIIPIVFYATQKDLLVTLALIYTQLFLLSYTLMICALRKGRYPTPNNLLIFLGMTLFVMCDISVAIWNLGRMGIITNEVVFNFASAAIWLFYTPSQVCLAISALDFSKGGKNGGN